MDCLTCARNAHCELRQLASDLNIDAVRYANDDMPPQIEDHHMLLGVADGGQDLGGVVPLLKGPGGAGHDAL